MDDGSYQLEKERVRREADEQMRMEMMKTELEDKFPLKAPIQLDPRTRKLDFQNYKKAFYKKFGKMHDRKTMRRLHRQYLKLSARRVASDNETEGSSVIVGLQRIFASGDRDLYNKVNKAGARYLRSSAGKEELQLMRTRAFAVKSMSTASRN